MSIEDMLAQMSDSPVASGATEMSNEEYYTKLLSGGWDTANNYYSQQPVSNLIDGWVDRLMLGETTYISPGIEYVRAHIRNIIIAMLVKPTTEAYVCQPNGQIFRARDM